jgi:putative adhesin
VTARGQRGAALLIGGVLALLFSAIAAVQVAGWTVGAVEHSNHQVIPGPVSKLSVDAGAGGDITVVRELSDLPLVTIDSTVKGSIHAPVLRAVKDGATVRINGNCPYISFGPCHARIVIRVPAGTEVDVRSGSGDVTAIGLSGTVDLETGSGDVNATGLTGDSDLHTSSGDVNVRRLRGNTNLRTGSGDIHAEDVSTHDLVADTASGDVELDFALAPQLVDASTASGDVDVTVPDGTYRVEDDPGSGKTHRNVKSDPAATRIIRAQTSSGDITIGYGN